MLNEILWLVWWPRSGWKWLSSGHRETRIAAKHHPSFKWSKIALNSNNDFGLFGASIWPDRGRERERESRKAKSFEKII